MTKIKLTMAQEADLKEVLRLYGNDKAKIIDIAYQVYYSEYTGPRFDYHRSLKEIDPKALAIALIEGYDVWYQLPDGAATVTIEEAEFVDAFTKHLTEDYCQIGAVELINHATAESVRLDRMMSVRKFIQAVVNGYEIE